MKENAKTFLINRLNQLVEVIPSLKILYKFDQLSREHLIKVLPKEQYEENGEYQEFEENLIFDFIDVFPSDNLVFLSEGEEIDFSNPDEIIEGEDHNTVFKPIEIEEFDSLISEKIIANFINTNDFKINFLENDLFKINNIEEDHFTITDEMFEIITQEIDENLFEFNYLINQSLDFTTTIENDIQSNSDSVYKTDDSQNNYALAA